MIRKTVNRKRRERVPFSPDAGLCESSSYRHFCTQLSLPNVGTIPRQWLSLPEKADGSRPGRVAFCAFSKASITVEAAFALPLFFFCVICLISIMNVYGKTLDQAAALRNTAMAAALAAGSGEEEQMIDLRVPILFRPAFFPEGLPGKLVPCRAVARVWNGRDPASNEAGKKVSAEYVYVTDNLSVYHTSPDCTHLDLTIRSADAKTAASMRNEYGERYHACEKCAAAGCGACVFITPYGDRYHTSPDCAGLKRTVRLVDRESIGAGLCECQRCAAARKKAA